jgi:Uma2 family endonuclease
MSAILPTPARPVLSPGVPTLPIYRLSVAQYHAMAEHGILTANDAVELLHGWLVPKMTARPSHAVCTDLVRDLLTGVLPPGWHVRQQAPITLDQSEPEPDGCIAVGSRRDFLARHPGPPEVALVVEVADTTLDSDRRVKKPLYAEARIPIYWIVNLEDNQLEVFTDPSGPGPQPDYAVQQVLGPADEARVVIAGHEVGRIAVGDLLP